MNSWCSPGGRFLHLLLDAFYADEMRPLPVEWEPFLSPRQLALQRGLQGRWEEAVRLEPLPLLAAHYGEFLYAEGEYTAAIDSEKLPAE